MDDFLVKLQTEYEFLSNKRIDRLESGLTVEGVVSACKKNVEDIRLHRVRIDDIIGKYLNPLLDNIENISDEQESNIFETVQNISAYEVRLDPGLAYKIYRKLLERARKINDPDKTLKYLYWCGITLFYFNNTQDDNILKYFEEGASHLHRYRKIKDADIRRYVHRCLGNYHMMLFTVNQIDKANEKENEIFNFWNTLIFSSIDLDFPWINYFLTCLTHKYENLMKIAHSNPDNETKENYSKILDAAISANKLYNKNKDLFNIYGGTRYEYILREAQFLSGLISFDQLCEFIYSKQAEYTIDDYSSDAIYSKISMSTFLMFYSTHLQELSEIKEDFLPEITKRIKKYISLIPKDVNTGEITRQLRSLSKELNKVLEPKELLEFILESTTYRNIPKYAHSLMVGKIAVCLAGFLIDKKTGYFDEYLNSSPVKSIIPDHDKLYEFLETCGLCHDIGKYIYDENIFMLARVLTEDELEIVKQHPEEGFIIFSQKDDLLYDGYKEVILGHHKFYDNSGGYPESFNINESKHKVIIDLIKAADSIDAATDDIGKIYSRAKSLDEVCNEIKQKSGSEYSPVIAELLNDTSVLSALKNILDTGRKEAYNTAYIYSWN